MARALEANTTLTYLHLRNNGIGAEGAAQVARALEADRTLTQLNLGGNGISDECVTELTVAVERNKQRTLRPACFCFCFYVLVPSMY